MKLPKIVVMLISLFFVETYADVVLSAKAVQRGCWTSSNLGGLWIHCSSFNNYQGSNYDYLEWKFNGSAGVYELQINHVAHFSGRPKHYVTLNGKTVYGPKEAPISKTGWCCADRGAECRKTAKDNLHLVKTGVKLTLKPGDAIRFYGNVHYGCPGHGNYSGIKEIILAGSGGAVTTLGGNSGGKKGFYELLHVADKASLFITHPEMKTTLYTVKGDKIWEHTGAGKYDILNSQIQNLFILRLEYQGVTTTRRFYPGSLSR